MLYWGTLGTDCAGEVLTLFRELKIGKSCVQLDSSIPEGMGLNSHVLVEILNVWPTAPLENFQVKVEQVLLLDPILFFNAG